MDIDDLLAALAEYSEQQAKWTEYRATNPFPHPYARESLDRARDQAQAALNAVIDARIDQRLRALLAKALLPDPQ